MAQCPVCQTDYGEEEKSCPVCGWDVTPYPPTFGQLPVALVEKRQAQLQWAQNTWHQLRQLPPPQSPSASESSSFPSDIPDYQPDRSDQEHGQKPDEGESQRRPDELSGEQYSGEQYSRERYVGGPSDRQWDELQGQLLAITELLNLAQAERTSLHNQIAHIAHIVAQAMPSTPEDTGVGYAHPFTASDYSESSVNFPMTAVQMTGVERAIAKAEVVVMELEMFEQTTQVLQALAAQQSVILNLQAMSFEDAQRTVDFVSGYIHGVRGRQEQLGEDLFLFVPLPPQALLPSASTSPTALPMSGE